MTQLKKRADNSPEEGQNQKDLSSKDNFLMLSQTASHDEISFFKFFKNLKVAFSMTKPTITLLVVVTALPAMFMVEGVSPKFSTIVLILLGAAGSSGSAAIFNQIFEADVDKKMKRTRSRSLPSERISMPFAVNFGMFLGVMSFALLYFFVNPLTAFIAASGHLFYVFVYTLYLKKSTPQNIVIGGVAGAIGPLMGCAGVSGSLNVASWILFMIIVLWTPPHFWALCLKYKKDYANAGIPMYPIVYGDERTRKVIFLYTLTLIPCVIALHFTGQIYSFTTLITLGLSVKFSLDAYKLYQAHNNFYAMPLFRYSCLYTFALFLFYTADRLIFHTLA